MAAAGLKGELAMAKYAIAFDLDTDTLSKTYTGNSHTNAYTDIKNTLEKYGFIRQQGSVYFGNETVDAVKTVMAARKLASKYEWFEPSVRDIRMLRIEDDNDLMVAFRDDD
ncbi:Virulence-associated protein D region [Mitsuokella sp. oral taxon 131 str. W9106]|nr:Virulence-associated protein D region [Mitsuokella sp. oral taxon 131 str. W9106]